MRNDNRLLTVFQDILRRLVPAVRNIRDNAQLVHLPESLPAKVGETAVSALDAAGTDVIGLVVGHLHYTEAKLVEGAQFIERILHRLRVLKGDNERLFALFLRPHDIVGGARDYKAAVRAVGKVIETADLRYTLAETVTLTWRGEKKGGKERLLHPLRKTNEYALGKCTAVNKVEIIHNVKTPFYLFLFQTLLPENTARAADGGILRRYRLPAVHDDMRYTLRIYARLYIIFIRP